MSLTHPITPNGNSVLIKKARYYYLPTVGALVKGRAVVTVGLGLALDVVVAVVVVVEEVVVVMEVVVRCRTVLVMATGVVVV